MFFGKNASILMGRVTGILCIPKKLFPSYLDFGNSSSPFGRSKIEIFTPENSQNSNLHGLIPSCTFINFRDFANLHFYSNLHYYSRD